MSGDLKTEPPSLEEIPLYEEDAYPVTLDDSIAHLEKLIAQQTDNTLEQEAKKEQNKKRQKRVLAAFRPQKRLKTQSERLESPEPGNKANQKIFSLAAVDANTCSCQIFHHLPLEGTMFGKGFNFCSGLSG